MNFCTNPEFGHRFIVWIFNPHSYHLGPVKVPNLCATIACSAEEVSHSDLILKHRPKIPVARQFMPWLDEIVPSKSNSGRTTYLAKATVRHGWDTMRAHLGLPEEGEAGQKLIRRSMATIVRKRIGEANWAQGKMMLGHVKFDVSDIYAIPDPANLGLVLAAAESVIDEIEKLCPGAFHREITPSGAPDTPLNGGLSV